MGELDNAAQRVALLLFLSVLVSAVVSGCASIRTYQAYKGDILPKSKIAILRETKKFYLISFCKSDLETIDGQDVNWAGLVEMLPGPHQVSFRLEYVTWGSEYRRGSFEFQAEAGHVYKLDVAKCTGIPPFQAWIEDQTTGRVVAGTRP